MKSISIISIISLLILLGCKKAEGPSPEQVSFGSAKGNYLMQEERIRFQSDISTAKHFYENSRLVKAISPEGPYAFYAYDPGARTVTVTYALGEGIPYGKRIFYFDENNQIIRSEEIPVGGGTTVTSYQYQNGSLVGISKRTDLPNGEVKLHTESCELSGGKITQILTREEEYINGVLKRKDDSRMTNKSSSPFVLRLYNEEDRLVRYMQFSSRYKSPTYNIWIYPDVDLSTLKLSRSSVIKDNDEHIALLDWYTHGMLQVEDRYFYSDGRENRWYIEDVTANKDGQPLTYKLYFKGYADPGYVLLDFEYIYVRL